MANKSDTSLERLREHLFDTIERVKGINDAEASDADKINLDAAKAVCNLSNQVIESAKVEVDVIRIIARNDDAKGNDLLQNSPLFFLNQSNKT